MRDRDILTDRESETERHANRQEEARERERENDENDRQNDELQAGRSGHAPANSLGETELDPDRQSRRDRAGGRQTRKDKKRGK